MRLLRDHEDASQHDFDWSADILARKARGARSHFRAKNRERASCSR